MNYRLGLDIGTNSIGWSIIGVENNEPVELVALGSRIFSDGRDNKTKVSLAVARRDARGIRRRRDRYLRRRARLMTALIQHGLMPSDEKHRKQLEKLNPYELRAKAVNEKIELFEIGRALFHINQRRGFKSNRKQAAKDNESGIIKEASKNLKEKLELSGYKTLGEFLYYNSFTRVDGKTLATGNPARFVKDEDSKAKYEFYPLREMYSQEFDEIWKKQKEFYPDVLTDSKKVELAEDIIFFQNPLKPVKAGRCTILPEEERMAWALPLAQKFRIIKEVNNLKFITGGLGANQNSLDEEQRRKIIMLLLNQGSLTFGKIKKALGFDSSYIFNLESEKRDKLDGDSTAQILRKDIYFGKKWDTIPEEEQNNIVKNILNDQLEDESLIASLMQKYGVARVQAENIISANLPEGYAKFCKKVIKAVVPVLESENITEDKALLKAGGWIHSQLSDGQIFEKLPYYGLVLQNAVSFGTGRTEDIEEKRIGKINNPTVHIALNQIRKLVNKIIEVYGNPSEVIIELARDLKKSGKEIAKIEAEIAKNTKLNERRKKEIEAAGLPINDENLLRMKLWEELALTPEQRRCIYTGETISISQLLSDQIEIEHILPFSRTLDDSAKNKTVCFRKANRDKGNKTPYEAFVHSQNGYSWDGILARADNLPRSKKWRFLPDAMKRFDDEEGGWLARQLTDTAYISKYAKQYLEKICRNVHVSNGKLTAWLRRNWGLNSALSENNEKNRDDHRHHAVDAFVIACTTRSMLKKVSSAAKVNEAEQRKISENIPMPLPDFTHAEFKERLDKVIVSHKPDHGSFKNGSTTGRLHEDTYYGFVANNEDNDDKIILHVTKPLNSLKSSDITKIKDPVLRRKIAEYEAANHYKPIKDALSEFYVEQTQGGEVKKVKVKKVKLLEEKNKDVMIAINNKENGKPYKYVLGGSNYCIDIFCTDKGKKAGKWDAEVIKSYDANQKNYVLSWQKENPTARKIMRLQINDFVAYEEKGKIEIRRVKKVDGATKRAYLVSHLVANEQADKLSWAASANQLQLKNARKVYVDEMGRVKDPKK